MARTRVALTRRETLRLAVAGWISGYVGRFRRARAALVARRGFLTAAERSTLAAAVDRMIPPDDDPGGAELGAVEYVDGLLGAFARVDTGRSHRPRIFAGGPFSGRHGGAPRFARFVRLTRVQEIAWRMRIEGSRGLPQREFNGPVRGLQDIYAQGLADLEQRARTRGAASFAALAPADQDAVLRATDPDFVDLLFQHTVEAAYAPPEYGGNRGLGGWRMIRFEGDRQPLGYSRYDAVLGRYVEFDATPVSRADPGPAPATAGVPRAGDGVLPAAASPLAAARRASFRALRAARRA